MQSGAESVFTDIQSCSLLNWIYFWFRCCCTPVPVIEISSLSHHILRYLRTLCIIWSLLRRRVTRRLTRLQTMRNALKYSKIDQNGSVRWRFGCGYFFNLLMFSTVYSFKPFDRLPNLKFEDTFINFVENHKHLGVTLTNKGNWNLHFDTFL